MENINMWKDKLFYMITLLSGLVSLGGEAVYAFSDERSSLQARPWSNVQIAGLEKNNLEENKISFFSDIDINVKKELYINLTTNRDERYNILGQIDLSVKKEFNTNLIIGTDLTVSNEQRANSYNVGGRYSSQAIGGDAKVTKNKNIYLRNINISVESIFGKIGFGPQQGVARAFAVSAPSLFNVTSVGSWKFDDVTRNDINTINDVTAFSRKINYEIPSNLLGGFWGSLQMGISYTPEVSNCKFNLCQYYKNNNKHIKKRSLKLMSPIKQSFSIRKISNDIFPSKKILNNKTRSVNYYRSPSVDIETRLKRKKVVNIETKSKQKNTIQDYDFVIKDAFELGLYYQKRLGKIDLGIGASYVTAKSEKLLDKSLLVKEDNADLSSLSFGINAKRGGVTIGGSIKSSTISFQEVLKDAYFAYDTGLTYERGKWGIMVGFGGANSDKSALKTTPSLKTSVAMAGITHEINKSFTIGAGAKYLVSSEIMENKKNYQETALFFESSFKF